MSLPLLAAIVLIALALGYRFYGGFIARQYNLQDATRTPAHERQDGVDFVPTRPFYLFGQHFSAIAAAGPIVGPILACQQYGWLPSILWIGVGCIFIGAVHDFSALVASVRHDAKSIAEVVKRYLGREAWLAMLLFIWLALIYVLVAFADLTAQTFSTGDTELAHLKVSYNQGGAVALAAMLYLGLAVTMGVVQRVLRPPLWLQTVIFVPATVVAIWIGTEHSHLINLSWTSWVYLIMAYCVVASLTPMWLLLQPRGYLGGFVLYGTLIIGTIGIFSGRFEIAQPAFKGLGSADGNTFLFPFLFVTIACGACSGFHGLVCSGTTSKQIDRESHCHPIGYGAMLLEAFVALIALATVMIVVPPAAGSKAAPATEMYAQGIGSFLSMIIGEDNRHIAVTFGAMALSTFVFDTIDSGTRLGRYVIQELFGVQGRVSAVLATLATAGAPLLFLMAGGKNSFRAYWSLFGTANQLLAGLTLLGISVWLRRTGKRSWFTFVPMLGIMAVTVTALIFQARAVVEGKTTTAQLNGVVALVLFALATTLVVYAARAVRAQRPA